MSTAMATQPRTLATITADMNALDDLLEQAEGELDGMTVEQTVEKWFADLANEESSKIDGYCAYLRHLAAEVKALKEYADDLRRKAQTREQRAAYLESRMLQHLAATKRNSIDTGLHKVMAVKVGGAPSYRLLERRANEVSVITYDDGHGEAFYLAAGLVNEKDIDEELDRHDGDGFPVEGLDVRGVKVVPIAQQLVRTEHSVNLKAVAEAAKAGTAPPWITEAPKGHWLKVS